MDTPSLHEHALNILEQVEAQIIFGKPTPQVAAWKPFPRHIEAFWWPIAEGVNQWTETIQCGFRKLVKAMQWSPLFLVKGLVMIRRWFIFWVFSLVGLLWVTGRAQIFLGLHDPHWVKTVFWGSYLLAACWVLFPVPSLYAHGGVQQDEIQATLDYLKQNKLRGEKELELLSEVVNEMEEPIKRRVSVYRLVVNFLWAGSVYLFGKAFDALWTEVTQGKVSHMDLQKTMVQIALPFSIGLLIYVAAHLVISAYELAVHRLYCGIRSGCIEAHRQASQST